MRTARDSTLALRAGGLLGAFNRATILTAADVHVALRLGRLGGETDESVLLAAALVVRSTRHGSVVLDLATAADTTSADVDEDGSGDVETPLVDSPPWPDVPAAWVAQCAVSPLVGSGDDDPRPLRLDGSRLWLARYWDQEELVAAEISQRCAAAPDDLDRALLATGLTALFPKADDADQRRAAELCATSRLSVLAGGPGTGKTTTVSRLLVLLRQQDTTCRIALAAPTGKAAARLEEAVRSSARDLTPGEQALLGDLSATTLHRLLGWRPEARSRFRHDRSNRLPFEVVVVDEASMVSLTMMARLLEALRPTTRLVLVGDPDQLASVEAGAVLGDLVAPTTAVPVARLRTNRRFDIDGGIARLARAVQDGHADDAVDLLRSHEHLDVELVEVGDDLALSAYPIEAVRSDVTKNGTAMYDAAARGDIAAALAALDGHRLLCAHRRGPRGVVHWSVLAQRWVAAAIGNVTDARDLHQVGDPLLVTSNDYELGLFNGDTGVVVADGRGGLVAAFGRGGAPIEVSLARLGAMRPLHAMTVHRSQGSEFARVTVLLPTAASSLATRETLYTAVTRATEHVRLIGSAEAVVAAIGRPAARATGLRERLLVRTGGYEGRTSYGSSADLVLDDRAQRQGL